VADILAGIVQDYGFDGYLLNIENKLEGGGEKLLEFMTTLNRKLKVASTSHLLIHYDSVLMDGELKWQNELNQHNKSHKIIHSHYKTHDNSIQSKVIDKKGDFYLQILLRCL